MKSFNFDRLSITDLAFSVEIKSIPIEMADSAPAPAPAKPAAKKATMPRKPADHPPTVEMIKQAVAALKERTGSSRAAIKKYLAAEYVGWEC